MNTALSAPASQPTALATGDVCPKSGVWVSTCCHHSQLAVAEGEVFPPCRACGSAAWSPSVAKANETAADEDDMLDEAPWRGLFTDIVPPAPAGWKLPPEGELPPRLIVLNLNWLPDHEDEE